MKSNVNGWLAVGLCCLLTDFARADLLGVSPSYPQIDFVNNETAAVSYDPASHVFSVTALPYSLLRSEMDQGTLLATNSSIQIVLDTQGNMVSGDGGFALSGQFSQVVNGVTNSYSGVMLQGDVIAFGHAHWGYNNPFDLRVRLTGGVLKPLFDCSDDLAVSFTSENSSFNGSFTNAFYGTARGQCGPEDLTPPTVTPPPPDQIVTTPALDATGHPGFVVTYPDPIVVDNCDPYPFSFCDTPSGSFVRLNPGDTLTITCYGIDVSGNFSARSFTVTLGAGELSCPMGFASHEFPAITRPTDPGQCTATYTFAPLIATNCSGQYFIATATALNELGAAIPLETLTNGLLQGQFPRTLTTNGNFITFTASDGKGRSVVRQCQVFVIDQEPPTIIRHHLKSTFKPISTNSLSSIAADFDRPVILAGDYIWFSSVIQASSDQDPGRPFTVHVTEQIIQLIVDNTNLTLRVPDAYVCFSNGAATASTVFTNNQWLTCSRLDFSGNTFAAGLAWKLPFNLNNLTGKIWGRDTNDVAASFRRHVLSASWSARFGVSTSGVALNWQWGAVVESRLNPSLAGLSVKPTDDPTHSRWKNSDPAGTCENFKPYLLAGARGNGISFQGGRQVVDCTGTLSDAHPCNLGTGIACEGVVNYPTPIAFDNCRNPVFVSCTPPPGSVFVPGDHRIATTAVDDSGNISHSHFTLTVLPPLQVVFDSPACDNVADNTIQMDAGFHDMNCPDSPSTVPLVTYFKPGDILPHKVRLLDCFSNDVTAAVAPYVTVHIDVTERRGTYANSVLVRNLPQKYTGLGAPGNLMLPVNGAYYYNLSTAHYPPKTANTATFFRTCVWVNYTNSPCYPVGMEDVLLQSR